MSKKDSTSNERFDSAIMSRVMARLSGCRAGRPPRPSPAALLRTRHSHTLRQHDFPQDAACPRAGKDYACSGRQRRWGRPARSMAARARGAVAVLLLAVAGLLAAPLPAQAQTEVPADWSLTPDGLVAGDKFPLLFTTSTKRNASSTDIADYNTFVQNRAAAGHADIQSYSSGFRVVGSTSATDARDNTSTTYTSTNKGVRIYWLNGNKVADEYEDFYDGTWDEESNPTNESGSFRLLSAQVNYPFTRSNDNGTKDTVFSGRYLGASNSVRVGRPGSSNAVDGPLYSGNSTVPTHTRPFYALSEVFQVPILPGAPRGLRSGAGDGQVTLYWSPPGSSGRILRYEYWRRSPAERDADGNEVWHAIPDSAPGGANAERFTVTGLTNGQLHIFMLRAVNAQAPGARANTTVTPVAGTPGAPGNLAAETVSDTEVRLSWTEPAAGAGVHITGYNIEKSTDGGVSWDGSSRTEAPGSTSATLGIGRNATRHYRIRTLFQRGEVGSDPFARGISAPSPPVEARTGEPVGFDLPRVGVSDGDGREGVDDAVVFTVWLDRAASETVRVFYQTFDITATAGADYVARSGAVEFAPGETQQTVAVAILDDDDEDNGEFFRLALSLPAVGAGARLEREAGGGTIRNSETPAATPEPEPVNTPATGRPTIAGTARVGATLDGVG